MITTVQVQVNVTKSAIASLLCSAIEAGPTNGCGYWGIADEDFSQQPLVLSKLSAPELRKQALAECKLFDKECWYVHWPLFEGGKLVFIEHNGYNDNGELVEVARHTLDLESIKRGLEVLANKFPYRFADVLMDDTDGPCGDLFLQCCFFGEEKYA